MRWPLLALAALGLGCTASADTEASFAQSPLTTVTSRSGLLEIAAYTAPEQPPSRGVLTLKLGMKQRADGAPADGLTFTVVPEMPSMGHGTPTVPRVRAQGAGTYLVEDVDLFMAGRWDLLLTFTSGTGDAATIPIDVR